MPAPRRFAIIGFGAITDEVLRVLEAQGALGRVAGILVRPASLAAAKDKAKGRAAVVDRIEALLDLEPEVVAECAGHGAMRDYAPAILARGVELLCSSVGVLADPAFTERLAAAATPGARVSIPSGAVAGIDGLLAARTAGLKRVTYTSVKPPIAWQGTPGEARLDVLGRDRRVAFFGGTAREAALQYPKNANVGATVAFAGLGLDATRVELVSDPAAPGPLGIIDAAGDFGTFRFEILAYAAPRNPKTSLLTAHSIALALSEGACFTPAGLLPRAGG